MRRLYQILLIAFVAGFVLICVYAFVEPVRAWMQNTIGPPMGGVGSAIVTNVTNSWIWRDYFVPFPAQLIWGAVILGFPIAWLWHKSYNTMRTKFVKSAARDSGMYPTMTEPVSSISVSQTQTPISTKKEEATASSASEEGSP